MSYRYDEQATPPAPRRVSDVAITRFDGVYEVDPELMTDHVTQQDFPNWDTLRLVHSRAEHLHWMHQHWCTVVVSGQETLAALDPPPTSVVDPETGSPDEKEL